MQEGNPVWLPEIGLGIGCERGNYCGVTREWMYWYDEQGQRYLTPAEQVKQETLRAQQETLRAQQEALRAQQEVQRAQQETLRAEVAEQRIQQLTEQLRALGIDPDNLG